MRSRIFILTALLAGLSLPAAAAAADGAEAAAAPASATAGFAAAEYEVFGASASATWRSAQPGGEIGGVRTEGGGPRHLGRKVKSGLLSLVLPGAGQFYNGDRTKAFVFAGVEAAIWAGYLGFDMAANDRQDQYEQYAEIYAGVQGEHPDSYWRAVASYLDSDAYNEAELREARAEMDLAGANVVGPEDAWQWRTEDHLQNFRDLRADASRAEDRRDFMFLFAIVNRAVAVFDAVRHAVDDRLSARVLGFDVALEVDPSPGHTRSKCTFKHSF